MLVFEGDDTLGRVEEEIWKPRYDGQSLSIVDDFFLRWGWKPKLDWKPAKGLSYARVVGYDILLRDSQAVFDGTRCVACPEIKRLLTTKQWSTPTITPQEMKTCNRIFAASLATEFNCVEPMHAFLRSMYLSNTGGCAVSDEKVREHYLMMMGELPTHGSAEMSKLALPEFEGGDTSAWKDLARVSAGDFSDVEWATACAQPFHDRHGADLAASWPRSWIN